MQINPVHIIKDSSLWSFILRDLAILIVILLFLPVILLSLSTSVPAWVWIGLAIADAILFFLQFRLSPIWRGIAISLAGMFRGQFVERCLEKFYFLQYPYRRLRRLGTRAGARD